MATISRYTTAPSLAQADEILDTHIDIVLFPPSSSASGRARGYYVLQTPEPSTPHPRRHLQTVLQLQNTLRALILSHLPPSTRRLTGLSDGMQSTPYLHLHRQRLRFVLALGGLSECAKSRWARASTRTPTSPAWGGAPEKRAYLLNTATKALGLGLDVDAFADARSVQQIGDYAKAHFWVGVLSLESVHRLGAIREAKRVLSDLVQVVCVEVAEAERIKRQVERVGRGEMEGTEEEEKVQTKMQELRDKDAVKRERGAECVKGIADVVLDNSGGLEEAWAELEGFVVARMNA
ncbi:hypothetical protein B0H14DRAFT_3570881 [Mycena olivaceomarginata]|nr:hypothetical protein B0H14DRAFT_3570881 [Mycena olivaceomarginata]